MASEEKLSEKYRDHQLINSIRFKNCRECHIEPDWLLVYKKNDEQLILLLIETGSHSDLFKWCYWSLRNSRSRKITTIF